MPTPTILASLARRLVPVGLGLALAAACETRGRTNNPDRAGATPTPVTAGGSDASGSGRVWPSPPPPTAPKSVSFPQIADFRLDNGLRVFVIENHEVPLVTAELIVRCGQIDGSYLAKFTASMLGEGTRSRSKAKLDEAIEFVGGSLEAGAGTHVSTVRARSLESDLKLAMLLMADEVLNPMFPPGALDKLRQNAKSALRFNRSQPELLADVLFDQAVYPSGHPYGQPLPTGAQLDAITIADVQRFHRTFYRANNSTLLLSGDINPQAARPLVERAFGSWASVELETLPANPLNAFTRYDLPNRLTVHLVDRPDSAQATIRVGNLALARNHEDWAALTIANEIFGGGPTSRLFQDIREVQGLTYRIGSTIDMGQAPGPFVISTQTRTPTTGAMLAALFGHIERMRSEDPSRPEFDTVVRRLVGAFPLEMETSGQIVRKIREQLVFGLAPDYWSSYREQLTQVELADVRRAAQRYIHAIPVVVVVGNAAEIRPQLGQVFPSVTIVDYDEMLQRK